MTEEELEKRLATIEARQVLLLRAGRMEWAQAPVGAFEAAWDAIDPTTPSPIKREEVK